MDNSRLNQLLKYLENDPDDSFLIFALAKEYEMQNQLEMALQKYLQLKEKDSDYIGLYYHLAKLYETLKKETLALSVYNEGLELGKKLKDFHAISELNNAKMNLELTLDN